jgi:DNA processing protein
LDPSAADKARKRADDFLRRAPDDLKVVPVTTQSAFAPLARAPSTPLLAYCHGDPQLVRGLLRVGLVGTRMPSPQGKERASALAARLVQRSGATLISGGAAGIDSAAHVGALEAGGNTVVIRPWYEGKPEHRSRMHCFLRSESLLVSFIGPWAGGEKGLFVARNAYIAALCHAVIIAEGRENSGALHTARFASAMGIPVWALTGPMDDPLHAAPHRLLHEGVARPLVSLDDFLETLPGGWPLKEAKQAQPPLPFMEPTAAQVPLMEALAAAGGPLGADMLAQALGRPMAEILPILMEMELLGLIRQQGGFYRLRHPASQ